MACRAILLRSPVCRAAVRPHVGNGGKEGLLVLNANFCGHDSQILSTSDPSLQNRDAQLGS